MQWIRDLKVLFIYFKIILKARKTEKWKRLNLHLDWIGRIWTVINIRNEDLGEPELVRKSRFLQRMEPYNEYFEKDLFLTEIITVDIEQKTDMSLLVVYYPLIRSLNIWKVLLFLIFLTAAIWGIVTYHQEIINFVINIIK